MASNQSAVIKAALIVVLKTEEGSRPSLENMAAVMMYNGIFRYYKPLSAKNIKINERVLNQMAKAGVNDGLRADIDSMVNTSGALSAFDGNLLVKECDVLHKSISSILEDIHAQPVSIEILKG